MAIAADRVLCSTITFRHLPLEQALSVIVGLGFHGIDLGALPGVCDHVPAVLNASAVEQVADVVRASGLLVRSVNADIGDLNEPLSGSGEVERSSHLDLLLDLCVAVRARALVLPNGRQSQEPITSLEDDLDRVAGQLGRASARAAERGVEVWVEAPHHFRLAHDLERSQALFCRLPEHVGAVCDVSHVVASGSSPRRFLELFGPRVRHVHLRDAEPGYIHHSIGNGQVDFAALVADLEDMGYEGALALELETRDVADADRPAAALAAAELISDLLTVRPRQPRPLEPR